MQQGLGRHQAEALRGRWGAGVAAPPEDTSLLAALGVVGPMGLRSMTTAPGHRQQPVLSCLTRTAPEAHGGQPGGGRWSVRFLPLFSPTNFNVWWGFLPEAGILLRPPVSFPGGGRRVLSPEERPCTQAGGGAAQLLEAIRTAARPPGTLSKGKAGACAQQRDTKPPAALAHGRRGCPELPGGRGLPHSLASPRPPPPQ